MELCPRCDGGAIHAPNCPVCGGSGFVSDTQSVKHDTALASPFRKMVSVTRQQREEEKRRKVKVLAVKKTPEQRRQDEHEALAAKREAMRQRVEAEKKKQLARRQRAPVEIRKTATGTVVQSIYRKEKGQNRATLPQAPTSRQRTSTSPDRNRTTPQKERCASRPGDKPKPPRESREAQSASQVRNSALADQLAALKTQLVVAPAVEPSPAPPPPPPPANLPPADLADAVPLEQQWRERRLAAKTAREAHSPRKKGFVRVKGGKLAKTSVLSPDQQSEERFVTVVSARTGRVSWSSSTAGHDDKPRSRKRRERLSEADASLFEQRYREEDGGWHMGHSFRDSSGGFGSMPLYDSHDDFDE